MALCDFVIEQDIQGIDCANPPIKGVESIGAIVNRRDINYDDISSLRIEARQKLSSIRPLNIGQASRISGVSPADISVLFVYLEQGFGNVGD